MLLKLWTSCSTGVCTRGALFCSESFHGVQAGSAARGDGGGGQPAEDEPKWRQSDSPGIRCGDTIEECMQQMVAPESDANSGSGPQCHEEQGLAHDHTDDSDAIGAKGHANANLPGPLFDQVAEQPVETGEGDEQREAAKNAHDACSQFLRTDGDFHGFTYCGEFADRE